MHEMSIVQALIEQVQVEVERSGQAGRVTRVDLAIGTLSGVHVDSLRFAFELLSPGTLVQGADLVIEQPPAHVHCQDCGAKPAIHELAMTCPSCGGGHVKIEGGTDLVLQSIELEQ